MRYWQPLTYPEKLRHHFWVQKDKGNNGISPNDWTTKARVSDLKRLGKFSNTYVAVISFCDINGIGNAFA